MRDGAVGGGFVVHILVVAVEVIVAGIDRGIGRIGVVDPDGRSGLDSNNAGHFRHNSRPP